MAYDRHDVTQTVTLAYRQRAFQHHEHAGRRLAGREYALAGMAARVYTMFAASKVDKLVNLCPTLREAEAFLSK